jgi:hypothetical protein
MRPQTTNRALVLAGSVCAVNGALLLLAPGRFVALRRTSWLPAAYGAAYGEALRWLARHRGASRGIGLAAASGLALLAAGVLRTEPA